MQAQKEQLDSTSKFMKEGFGIDVLTKDLEELAPRLNRTNSLKKNSKRKKHKKKRTKARR